MLTCVIKVEYDTWDKTIRCATYLASMTPGEKAKGASLIVTDRHDDSSCTRRARGSA